MTTFELKFDEKKVDTSKAEAYLLHKNEFHGSVDESGEIETDPFNNKINLSNTDLKRTDTCNNDTKENISMRFYNLSQKIEDNAELFCQLEYLIRKIPTEHVKNFDIKLLVQNYKYCSLNDDRQIFNNTNIIMTEDKPLAILGYIRTENDCITSTKETAAICSLFVDICKEVGFHVHLQFVTKSQILRDDVLEEFRTGGVGIVTGMSDIDSAVDSFLYATSRYPWRIKKIFVQECVLNRFKKAIEWKTRMSSGTIEAHLTRSCTSVYVYEGKKYLFEFAGNVEEIDDDSVVIEAYRTTKELIAIISNVKPLCASVWSSNIAETNEITQGIDSNIIWINDYGNFDGPPVSSQAFYSITEKSDDSIKTYQFYCNKHELLENKESWLKLDITKRFIKIIKALNEQTGSENKKLNIDFKLSSDSTVVFGNSFCIVTRSPIEACTVFISSLQDCVKWLNYIVDGGAVVFGIMPCLENNIIEDILRFFDILTHVNAPVQSYIMSPVPPYRISVAYSTKSIWTSNGTTFAN